MNASHFTLKLTERPQRKFELREGKAQTNIVKARCKEKTHLIPRKGDEG